MSEFNLHFDGTFETDKVFFLDRSLHRKGEIYPITDLKTIMRFNENSEVSFTVHKYNNGEMIPLWDDIDDIKLIEVEHKGIFEIDVPKTEDTSLWKSVHGISLAEAELSQKKCTLEVNTENDIAREDYVDATILYEPDNSSISLLDRILTYAPHYSIGHVDGNLQHKQRTFTWSDVSVYDALQDIAKELDCIFLFDRFQRVINCYDLENYGVNSGVLIDGCSNLADSISVTGNTDNVKNCFKIEGGDEEITNRIGNRLISGNRLWMISDYQKAYMSSPLQQALAEHDTLIADNQDEYNQLWDSYNQLIEKKEYYESSMMPSTQTDDEEYTAQKVYTKIWEKITYACATSSFQSPSTIALSLKSYAKILMPAGYSIKFSVSDEALEVLPDGKTTLTFTCQVYLDGEYKDDGVTLRDTYTGNRTLEVKNAYILIDDNGIFTNDYYMYLKQQIDASIEKSGVSMETIRFDPPISEDVSLSDEQIVQYAQDYASYNEELDEKPLPYNHYTKFSRNRLKSFCSAYEACSLIVGELNSNISGDKQGILKYTLDNGETGSIFHDLLGKYHKYIVCLSARISYLDQVISDIQTQIDSIMGRITAIRKMCNLENFLKSYHDGIYGDTLWKELCSFIREDTYTNSNYTADGLDEHDITENIGQLIDMATKEIKKASTLHYTINTTIGNLYLLPEFQPFWNCFDLGNYINVKIDKDIYRLRLIEISVNYTDVGNISVAFSEFTKTEDKINDVQNILSQAHAIAGSFSSVAKQAEKGNATAREYREMKAKGLDVATTMITNSDDEEFIINQYGLTGRMYNPYTDTYSDEQIKIIHNLLAFTDDSWKSTRLALGNIYYQDLDTKEWRFAYGLNAEVLISNIVLTENLKIFNESGTYSITDRGFIIDQNGNKISISAENSRIELCHGTEDSIVLDATQGSFVIQKGNTKRLLYTPSDGLNIIGKISSSIIETSRIDGGTITGATIEGRTINGGTIEGGTISGVRIEGTEIVTNTGRYSLKMEDGILSIGNIKIFNGLLNYFSDANTYANAFNIACNYQEGQEGYNAEFGFRWENGHVSMISENCLDLGEHEYPIRNIRLAGELSFTPYPFISNSSPVISMSLAYNSNVDNPYPYLRFTHPIKAPNIQSGKVHLLTPTPNKETRYRISFPVAFNEIPVVVVSPDTQVPGTILKGVGTKNIDQNGFDIYATRANNKTVTVNWIAMTTEYQVMFTEYTPQPIPTEQQAML